MISKGDTKKISIISNRNQLQRCCICGDFQILVEYMRFMVCPFCAAEEKIESDKELTD